MTEKTKDLLNKLIILLDEVDVISSNVIDIKLVEFKEFCVYTLSDQDQLDEDEYNSSDDYYVSNC